MMDNRMEFTERAVIGRQSVAGRSRRSNLERGLGVLIALAGCGVLATVWRATGDENRRQAIAAARAVDQARCAAERVAAIQELVQPMVIDGELAVPPLIRSLADTAPDVRVDAARALGQAAAAAALIGTADDQVRAAIAALVWSLDDPEPAVRIAAVHSLGAIAASKNPSGVIRPRALVDALAAMLGDPDHVVRASTIASLGFAGPLASPNPPPALIAALDDESGFNRAAAAHSLARFPAQQ